MTLFMHLSGQGLFDLSELPVNSLIKEKGIWLNIRWWQNDSVCRNKIFFPCFVVTLVLISLLLDCKLFGEGGTGYSINVELNPIWSKDSIPVI